MKIVMFTDAYWPRINGVTVSVDSFSRALIKEGHEVLIVCSYYPEDLNGPASISNQENPQGPKVVRVPSLPVFISKEDRIAKFNKWFWVFKQVELFNPDIIHINSEFVIAEFGYFYAWTHNIPAIYTFHTMWEDYGPNYFPIFPSFMVRFFIRGGFKYILRRPYRVIVPTTQIEEVVQKYKPGKNTFLLPTGIDLELFEHDQAEAAVFRDNLEAKFPILRGKRILLFAGRVTKEKNIGFLLKILPKILARHPDIILLIVGNGPDLEFYKEEVRTAALEEVCVFTGYMERSDLALSYMLAEVFVFPSMTDTQGLVTLEAMLSGTPVVAIGVLGTLAVMGGDNGGFMVKNDQGEFTSRVLELLEDRELHQKKSREARIHARAWSIGEMTKKLIGLYEASLKDYREEYGEPRNPMWNLLDRERWTDIHRIFRKKASQKMQEVLSKLLRQP